MSDTTRIFITAIWGPDVSNYHVREHESGEQALLALAGNIKHLENQGYVPTKTYTQESENPGVSNCTVRQFQHPETGAVRETGFWHQEPQTVGDRNPGHCEAAYLRTE